MILIFDFFETLINNRSIDFNRALKPLWEKYYRDRCSFEEMEALGEDLFVHMLDMHREGDEFPFVKDELPLYAKRFGGDVVTMTAEEEADFLMLANDMEPVPELIGMLDHFTKKGVPMYVLSNSGFTAAALSLVLECFGVRKYFTEVFSSADFGRVKPCKEFFDLAITRALTDHPDQTKDDILFVGDYYETDVIGAHNAGIKVAWINRRGEEDRESIVTYEIAETYELTKQL